MVRRLLLLQLLLVIAATGCSSATRINGGGASFIYPLMLKWTKVYDERNGIQIDYQSTGSGNGQQQTIAGTINFGCSDAPISDANLKKAEANNGPMVHVPLVMGAVVPIYNIEGVGPGLRFTGDIIANIYLGKITYWDDDAITSINRDFTLPHAKINLARRADSSGTTAIFTDYLSKVSKEWTKEMTGTAPSWPKAVQIVGVRGNEGVAGFVHRTSNSFGYVELIYAKQNNVTYGVVKNRDGNFVNATLESVTAAAEASRDEILEKHPDLRFSLTNARGAESYPISGTNWAVLYAKQPSTPGRDLVQFLRWATKFDGEGQRMAGELGYAPLPSWMTDEVGKKLDSVVFAE